MVRLALAAMATRFELVLCGEDEVGLRAAGEAACEEIRDCERRYSRFDPASLVSHLAREAGGRWVRIDADAFELLEVCAAVNAASGGAFDPAVGAAMDALRAGRTPARVHTFAGVELDAGRSAVRFRQAGLQLDLGGIGKGVALDAAARVLAEAGVASAFLHGGTSTALALGPPPGQDAWRVELPGGAPVALVHRALSVSRAGGRDGRQATVDPLLGHVAPRARAACVTARSAAEADAWSTALTAGASCEALPTGLRSIPIAP